jgi:DMSO/TMAO reductase YedYZ heme-binding membrane subunit
VSVHLSWYISRASGIVAWALLSLSVIWGVVLSTRLLGKRATPAWLLDLHRFLGGTALVFVGIHLAGLVGDGYVHFGWSELFVPLASVWQPVAVAWGIVALYLLVAVELTSLVRKHLPATLWRRVHQTSFAVWVLSSIHLFAAGTDASNPVLQWATLVLSIAVIFTVVVRVLSPKPDKRTPRPSSAAGSRVREVVVPAAGRQREDRKAHERVIA